MIIVFGQNLINKLQTKLLLNYFNQFQSIWHFPLMKLKTIKNQNVKKDEYFYKFLYNEIVSILNKIIFDSKITFLKIIQIIKSF
jgi:hypothetical protein